MDLFNTKKIAQLDEKVSLMHKDVMGLFASLLELKYPNVYKALTTNTGKITRVDINTVILNDGKSMPIKAVEAMFTPKRTRKSKIEQTLKVADEIMLASAEKIKDMVSE